MPTRDDRSKYPASPFDIAESQLCQELEAYYEAIHTYPDHFAQTPMSFQEHLLHIICAGREQATAVSEPDHLKSAS